MNNKDLLKQYAFALDVLDDYDHQRFFKPEGREDVARVTYDDAKAFVEEMGYKEDRAMFGNEKDASFMATLGNLYQTVLGDEVYPTLEEKAAHLLYFVVKNHSFSDGNKRIGAALFLYYLDRNNALFKDGQKVIDDATLVSLTLMIAHSRPEEKDGMISIIMRCLTKDK